MADDTPTTQQVEPLDDESTRFGPKDRKRWILVRHDELQAPDAPPARIHAAAWPAHSAAGYTLVDDDPDGVAQRDAQDDAAVLPVEQPTTAGGRQATGRVRPSTAPGSTPDAPAATPAGQ